MNNCDEILKDDGVISLVIPDKRYCFDRYRPISAIGKIIDSYYQKNTIHTPGNVAEYYLNIVAKAGQIGWDKYTYGGYNLIHTIEDAKNGINSVTQDGAYIDIHSWCFVPHSFRLVINDLYSLGLISFQEICFFPTDGLEFYITLGRKGKGIDISREKMLERIEVELKSIDNAVSINSAISLILKYVNIWKLKLRLKQRARSLIKPALNWIRSVLNWK